MKYLICAQPKSASTSLMHGVGSAASLTFGQSFFVDPTKMSASSRVLRKMWNGLAVRSGTRLRLADTNEVSGRLRSAYPAFGYECLSAAHSDMADFPATVNIHELFPMELHKQHFPPTRQNLVHLASVTKVVLVRDIEHSVDSYMRVPTTSENVALKQALLSRPDFRDKMAEELEAWQLGWTEVARKSGDLILDYERIVSSPSESLSEALEHFGFTEIDVPLHLPRKRSYNFGT